MQHTHICLHTICNEQYRLATTVFRHHLLDQYLSQKDTLGLQGQAECTCIYIKEILKLQVQQSTQCIPFLPIDIDFQLTIL